jgi:hypothetical protein
VPASEDHLANARRWRAVEDVVREAAGSPEWSITILFYRAVHFVEAAFARDGVHYQTHRRRTAAVERDLPVIAGAYLDLLDLSRLARYAEPTAVTWEDYDTARLHFSLIETEIGKMF